MLNEKRARGPSFVLVLAVLFAFGASASHSWVLWWLSAAVLIALWVRSQPLTTPQGLPLIGFLLSGWLLFHSLAISPTLRPEAIFVSLFIFAGLVFGRQLNAASIAVLLRVLMVPVAIFAI